MDLKCGSIEMAEKVSHCTDVKSNFQFIIVVIQLTIGYRLINPKIN